MIFCFLLKVIQREPIYDRGYRHQEPWPTRVALNHGSEEEQETEAEVEKIVDAILMDEGSGLGSTFNNPHNHNNNNNNHDNDEDDGVIPMEAIDSLEKLYTTIADENFNMWTDSSSIAGSTTTTTKTTTITSTASSQKPQNDDLEKYIKEHKTQTIDTSNEDTTTTITITTTTPTTTIPTTTITTEATETTIYPTREKKSSFKSKEEYDFFDAPIVVSEEELANWKDAKSSSEKEEAEIIATPPRHLKNSYKHKSQEQLLVDNDLWFTDDEFPVSIESLLLKSDAEDDKDLASLYNAEEPALFPQDYAFHEEIKKKQQQQLLRPEDYQQPWPYNAQAYDDDEETAVASPIDSQHLPQFIEQLVGHLGKMSNIFTASPPTYHKIPGAIYPTTYHNHLNNFRDAYADESKQQSKIKRKIVRMPMESTAYVDPTLGTWFNEQPREIKDAVNILKILFPRN